jgi:hypothetical protein
MSVSADANSAPVVSPRQTDFQETAALIKEITAEARASGKPIFEPAEGEGDPESSEPAEPSAAPGEASEEAAEATDEDAEATDEEAADEPSAADGLDLAEIQAALNAEGDLDLEALAKALKIDLTKLQITPSQFKAARIERRKSQETLKKAEALQQKLEKTYGDQVRARQAAVEGDLNPAIEFVEGVFGMGWNELNTLVADLLQGKPAKDLEQKRELRELKKREADRAAAAKEQAAEVERVQQIDDAKKWIGMVIRGDKLADQELNQQLKLAGMPTIVDLVFEEMQANYSKGLTDPAKALDRVKAKLSKQAKALQAAGVIPKTEATKPAKTALTARPRATAQSGSAGNGRPLTDAELRRAVLKEAGLLR